MPLQPRTGFVHPWFIWWTTLQMLVGCYISSVPRTLIVLLWITCIPPTISSWYPCINWRLVMRMRIIGWNTAYQFMSKSHWQCIPGSSIPQYEGLPWVHNALFVTSSWSTVCYWCKIIQSMCLVPPFLQWLNIFQSHNPDHWSIRISWRPSTCASHTWSVSLWSTGSESWVWGISGKL